jgi:hypothetical protein
MQRKRFQLIALLFLCSVPTYAEWVSVGGNGQAGLAIAQLSLTQVHDRKPAAEDPVPQTGVLVENPA